MSEAIPAFGLAATVFVFIAFAKAVTNRDWNGVVTQLTVWVSGVVATFLWASSQWAAHVDFNGEPLSKLNGSSLVIAGVAAGSAASAGYQALKALDGTQSAKQPPLLPGPKA